MIACLRAAYTGPRYSARNSRVIGGEKIATGFTDPEGPLGAGCAGRLMEGLYWFAQSEALLLDTNILEALEGLVEVFQGWQRRGIVDA